MGELIAQVLSRDIDWISASAMQWQVFNTELAISQRHHLVFGVHSMKRLLVT